MSISTTNSKGGQDKDSLFIYVAKEIPENKAGATSKRQITVTVPSEYLDEISPKHKNGWFHRVTKADSIALPSKVDRDKH